MAMATMAAMLTAKILCAASHVPKPPGRAAGAGDGGCGGGG